MNNLSDKIVKAIQEGLQDALEFSLDDFNGQDEDLYIKKKKKSIEELDREAEEYYKSNLIKVGDILYSNFKRNNDSELLTLGNAIKGIPIGVCCIPPYFLPDEEARFISYDTVFRNQMFGHDPIHYRVNCFESIKTKDWMHLNGYFCSENGYLEQSNKLIENPYNGNHFNANYSSNDSEKQNALSDLQGWKNQENILNNIDVHGLYAAQQCYKFRTNGTKRGDWYLPSIGELGIMFAKFEQINAKMHISNTNVEKDYSILSSTLADLSNVFYLENDGWCYTDYVDNGNAYVYPFFHIKLSKQFLK